MRPCISREVSYPQQTRRPLKPTSLLHVAATRREHHRIELKGWQIIPFLLRVWSLLYKSHGPNKSARHDRDWGLIRPLAQIVQWCLCGLATFHTPSRLIWKVYEVPWDPSVCCLLLSGSDHPFLIHFDRAHRLCTNRNRGWSGPHFHCALASAWSDVFCPDSTVTSAKSLVHAFPRPTT